MSEQEYERLRAHCLSVGARSISDLARSTLCELTLPSKEYLDDSLQTQIRHLYGNFQTLSEQMLHISRQLERRSSERKGEGAASPPRLRV